MGRMNGKVVLVTGAGSGIGAADARVLAREGATLILTDINDAAVAAVAAELPGAVSLRHDVTREEDWKSVISFVRDRFGRLDGLINNAGVASFANIEDETLDQWHFILSVSVDGSFLGCKTAIPLMRESGGGSIVNMSSIASQKGYPATVAYSTAKAALRGLTKSVAMHCIESGNDIRCNAVMPGTIDTPMLSSALTDEAYRQDEDASGPVGKMAVGQPEDVAELVLYLLSDESRFVTGSDMGIDGGEAIR